MSSMKIQGISSDLEKDYWESFNDTGIKFMFTVVIETMIMERKNIVQNFRSCVYAYEFTEDQLHLFSRSEIFLNRIDGSTLQLTEWDIEKLINFERKMWDHDDDEKCAQTEQRVEEASPEKEDEDAQEKYIDSLKFDIECLQFDVTYAENQVKEQKSEIALLKEQLSIRDRELREVAMQLIIQMEEIILDRCLLDKDPLYKLPSFKRAQVGDPDYPEITVPQQKTLFTYPKRRMTGIDMDRNVSNYASVYRGMLRWMSEEDFKKMCYLD